MNSKLLVLTLLLGMSACAAPEIQKSPVLPQARAHSKQHAWLMHLTGVWGLFTPGGAPTGEESIERVRSIGGMWIVAEGHMNPGPQSYSYILTLGYDNEKELFVGSWVDTVQPMMWTYTGTLDEKKRTLTLEAEGPSFDDPTKTTQYRDLLQLVNSNHKRITSYALAEDGTWKEYMSADYYRKK